MAKNIQSGTGIYGKINQTTGKVFCGSAWKYDAATDQYYYHSFAEEQADLNWQNQEVRQAVFDVLRFWLDRGVDGFRFDVINNLTVSDQFIDNPVGKDGKQDHRNDVNQPGIKRVLKELNQWIKAVDPSILQWLKLARINSH